MVPPYMVPAQQMVAPHGHMMHDNMAHGYTVHHDMHHINNLHHVAPYPPMPYNSSGGHPMVEPSGHMWPPYLPNITSNGQYMGPPLEQRQLPPAPPYTAPYTYSAHAQSKENIYSPAPGEEALHM